MFYNVAVYCTDVLKGQVAWITGASSGIGKHVAYELARVGCKLVLSARSTTELENVRKDCLSLYRFCQFLPRCMECRRGIAMRILSVCLSVCPSICPSVTRVDCDKMVEISVQICIPYERSFSLVFWEEEWLVGGDPFYLKFWVNRSPLEQNRRFWTDNRS